MVRSLVIHTDRHALESFQKKSDHPVLTASSMVQALKYLASAETPIRAIYLSTDDPSFSPLRFVEACLLQRPATPIYVFDSRYPARVEDEKLHSQTLVRGWANPNPTNTNFLYSDKLAQELSDTMRRPLPSGLIRRHPGFTPVPLCDFHLASTYPFDLFVEGDDGMLRLFALSNTDIDGDYFRQLAKKTDWLFIQSDQLQEVRTIVKKAQRDFAQMDCISNGWKTSELFFKTQSILTEIRNGGLQEHLIEQTSEMLAALFQVIQDVQTKTPHRLIELIERAKKSDKSASCATLSFLVCRALEFEKSSTVEILGVASLFQDISLYETPFGDLSKKPVETMSKDELSHYQRHPMLSADLIEQSVSMPQVTLQVIRQSHERRDRTGYPNRIGGTQLHPMAEVLSLINAYADLGITQVTRAFLKANVYPHYSEKVVQVFEKVLYAIEASAKS